MLVASQQDTGMALSPSNTMRDDGLREAFDLRMARTAGHDRLGRSVEMVVAEIRQYAAFV